MLAELSANAGRVLTYEHLLEKGLEGEERRRHEPHAHHGGQAARQAGRDARNPTYIFTESRVGYWMPEGDGPDLTP